MPAWIYSLGSVLSTKANIEIPFFSLLINLLVTVIPCLIGLLISIFYPKTKSFAIRYTKPFVITIIISFFVLLFTSRMFVFQLITIENSFSVLIPWFGFAIGAFIAFLFNFSKSQMITICLETGFQNLGIAFLIVTYNFPSPESDMALLPLICLGFLTPLPLYFILLIRFLHNSFKNKYKKKEFKEYL